MSEPERDHGGVARQPGVGCIAQVCRSTCGGEVFASSDGQAAAAVAACLASEPFDRVGAQRLSAPRREHRIGGAAVTFVHPAAQHGDGVSGQRCRRVPCGLCRGTRTWAPVPRCDVGAGEPGQFGDAQPGLHGDVEQGVVAAANPGGPVGRGQQGVDFVAGQEADDRPGRTRLAGMASTRCDQARRVLDGAARRSGTASGSRRAGRCGCGRCCAGRVPDGSGTRDQSASRSPMSSGRAVCRCVRAA